MYIIFILTTILMHIQQVDFQEVCLSAAGKLLIESADSGH